jgi:hypothetical protein
MEINIKYTVNYDIHKTQSLILKIIPNPKHRHNIVGDKLLALTENSGDNKIPASTKFRRRQNSSVDKIPALTKFLRRQNSGVYKIPVSTKSWRRQNPCVNKISGSTKFRRRQNSGVDKDLVLTKFRRKQNSVEKTPPLTKSQHWQNFGTDNIQVLIKCLHRRRRIPFLFSLAESTAADFSQTLLKITYEYVSLMVLILACCRQVWLLLSGRPAFMGTRPASDGSRSCSMIVLQNVHSLRSRRAACLLSVGMQGSSSLVFTSSIAFSSQSSSLQNFEQSCLYHDVIPSRTSEASPARSTMRAAWCVAFSSLSASRCALLAECIRSSFSLRFHPLI